MTLNINKSQRIKALEDKYCKACPWRWFYLKPKYWLVWFFLGILWCLGRLPMAIYLRTGKTLGVLLMHVLKKRQRIARRNIELCFPHLSADERQNLVRDNFKYAGIALLEPGLFWFSRLSRIKKLYRFEGLEHYEKLKEKGANIILCGLHMQCLEAMGRILCDKIATSHLYRVNNNIVYEYIISRRRASYPFTPKMIPHKRIKDFLYLVQSGQTGSIIPDHDLGRQSSLFVPFFGQQAATVPAVSVYANKCNAKILMMDYYLDLKTKQYVFRISSPLDNFPTKNKEADTLRISQIIENLVKEHPEQYLWMHRRFKTRLNKDDPSLYD